MLRCVFGMCATERRLSLIVKDKVVEDGNELGVTKCYQFLLKAS